MLIVIDNENFEHALRFRRRRGRFADESGSGALFINTFLAGLAQFEHSRLEFARGLVVESLVGGQSLNGFADE